MEDSEREARDVVRDPAPTRRYRSSRRIGQRVQVDPAGIDWWPSPRSKGLLRRARRSGRGAVVELSVSGAKVWASADRRITVGTRVVIGVNGDRGLVEVRRIDTTVDPTRFYYGVKFIGLDAGLQQLFDRTIAAHLRDGRDDGAWRWELAR